MEDTWDSREIPGSDRSRRSVRGNAGHAIARGSDIAAATGLSIDKVGQALIALDGEYLELLKTVDPYPENWRVERVFSHARRAVGQWPSPETLLSRVTAALEQVADDTEDPQSKSKLLQAATALGGVAQKVLADVGARLLEHQAGLG